MTRQQHLLTALAATFCLLGASAGSAAQDNQSDRFFRECRAAWADNNIGLADELCYKALMHPDVNAITPDAKSQRLYNYAQLKRMLGNWEGAEELLRDLYAPFVRSGAPILFMDIPSAEVGHRGDAGCSEAGSFALPTRGHVHHHEDVSTWRNENDPVQQCDGK